uniref:Thioredoxin domain-containing protein n=1 Tax=Steinernema glaseri TaxID=37863 RepID=A0A1I7ZTX3_9BILA
MVGLPSQFWLAFAALISIVPYSFSEVITLSDANFDTVMKENQLVFVNFYADWCRFSQMLKPIFAEASEKFKDAPGKVAYASVDCDRQPDLGQRFHVTKYPTLKLFRYGELVKREYRGQRSVEAFTTFIEDQMKSALTVVSSPEEFSARHNKEKRSIVAYFAQASGPEYDVYQRVAATLKGECDFFVGVGPQLAPGGFSMTFIPANSDDHQAFNGNFADQDFVKAWVSDKCVPIVRELTFENAEELTEEGLPFLILFRKPGDKETERIFTEQVIRETSNPKQSINCLVADGQKFAHPLHHLGKTVNDLPLIVIDSFRHMYMFPDMKKLGQAGSIRDFVQDLHSGKLHREFHHGPDPTQPVPQVQGSADNTQPPQSVFKQLKPSDNRYSIINKDEL